MATKHQIKCINKRQHNDPHERIKNIGGVNENGTAWKLALDDAIEGIEDQKWAFYVQSGTYYADVEVAKAASGRKYLRTVPDHTTLDNLLHLKECL